MVLGETHGVGIEASQIKAGIDVPGEGIDGRPLFLLHEAAVAPGIERGERIGDVHQRGQFIPGQLRRGGRQKHCLFGETRLCRGQWRQRPLEVEGLGGR